MKQSNEEDRPKESWREREKKETDTLYLGEREREIQKHTKKGRKKKSTFH